MASAIRHACTRSSERVRHRKNDPEKNRSMDMYGRIITGTKGMCRSHWKKNDPTLGRCEVKALHQP